MLFFRANYIGIEECRKLRGLSRHIIKMDRNWHDKLHEECQEVLIPKLPVRVTRQVLARCLEYDATKNHDANITSLMEFIEDEVKKEAKNPGPEVCGEELKLVKLGEKVLESLEMQRWYIKKGAVRKSKKYLNGLDFSNAK